MAEVMQKGTWGQVSGEETESDPTPSSNRTSNQHTAVLLKVLFIFLIFIITVCSGLAPIKSRRFRESSHLLGIANTFSGGVFLAIAFVHIIPETSNNYYMSILERNEVLSQVNKPQ